MSGRLNHSDILKMSLANFMNFHHRDLLMKTHAFHEFIEEIKKHGYDTYRRPLASACDHRVTVYDPTSSKNCEMIMMGSNNYLGLANHPKVIEAAEKALKLYGVGSGGVPLLSGTQMLHRELEQRLAKLKGCEDAVLFSSGYAANLGILTALLTGKDTVINDRLNHASIIDGCRLSGASVEIFEHNQVEHLESILAQLDSSDNAKLIVVDGVYSMDGDMAPLKDIVPLKERYGAYLAVDEAHATGVVGPGGRGTLAHHQVEGRVDFVTITLSKGLGCQGGAVACSKESAEFLRFFSRSTFFSTSLAPAVVAGAIAAINVLEEEPERRERLWKNIAYMLQHLRAMGYDTGKTESAIIPIHIGEEDTLRKMSGAIHEGGIYLNAIPYPAVPRGRARFRIGMMATHTQEDMDQTLEVLRKVGREFGVLKST
ncbi:MAG: aminotransferase class I/II-fold pyridoxal phosphate-dependent enzyme [Candidatus Omnitrophota bacterium]